MPNLFLSGSIGSALHRDAIHKLTTHRLLSLHGSYLKVAQQWLNSFPSARDPAGVEVMFDSGAFTAWSKGEKDIEVSTLLRTYKLAQQHYGSTFKHIWYINLDKIPGKPGRKPTEEEIVDAVRVSDENYKILVAELGLSVLPVFHQTESLARLQEIIEMNPGYVCLSPRNDWGNKIRKNWAQRVHKITKKVNTHGLGATGGEMICTVPWHSVDSASWIQYAAYGMIIIQFEDSFISVPISEHKTSMRRLWGRHYDSLSPGIITKRIAEQADRLNLKVNDLRTILAARELFNVSVMYETAEKPHIESYVQQTLFEV